MVNALDGFTLLKCLRRLKLLQTLLNRRKTTLRLDLSNLKQSLILFGAIRALREMSSGLWEIRREIAARNFKFDQGRQDGLQVIAVHFGLGGCVGTLEPLN